MKQPDYSEHHCWVMINHFEFIVDLSRNRDEERIRKESLALWYNRLLIAKQFNN